MPITSSFKLPLEPPPVPRLPLLLWALRFCPVVLTSCLSGYSDRLCAAAIYTQAATEGQLQPVSVRLQSWGHPWTLLSSSAKQSWFPWHVWSTCPSPILPTRPVVGKTGPHTTWYFCCCNSNTVNKNGRRGYPEIKVVTSAVTGVSAQGWAAMSRWHAWGSFTLQWVVQGNSAEWPRAQYIRGCLWLKYHVFIFLSSINISMYIDFAEIEILIKIYKIYWLGLNYSQVAQYSAPSLNSKIFVAVWKLCVCLYYTLSSLSYGITTVLLFC